MEEVVNTILPSIIDHCFRMLDESDDLLRQFIPPFSRYTLTIAQFQSFSHTREAAFLVDMRESLASLKTKFSVVISDDPDQLKYVAFVDARHDQITSPEIIFTTVLFTALHNTQTEAEAEHAVLQVINAFFHELQHLWLRTSNVRFAQILS